MRQEPLIEPLFEEIWTTGIDGRLVSCRQGGLSVDIGCTVRAVSRCGGRHQRKVQCLVTMRRRRGFEVMGLVKKLFIEC